MHSHTHICNDNLNILTLCSPRVPASSNTTVLEFDPSDASVASRASRRASGGGCNRGNWVLGASIPPSSIDPHLRSSSLGYPACHRSRHHSRRDFRGREPLQSWETRLASLPAPPTPDATRSSACSPPASTRLPPGCSAHYRSYHHFHHHAHYAFGVENCCNRGKFTRLFSSPFQPPIPPGRLPAHHPPPPASLSTPQNGF